MPEIDTFTFSFIVVGLLLITMTLSGSFIARLPLSSAMLYLGVGVAMGPLGLGLLQLDARTNARLLERLTEIAVLVSLFTAGMKLELPLVDGRRAVGRERRPGPGLAAGNAGRPGRHLPAHAPPRGAGLG